MASRPPVPSGAGREAGLRIRFCFSASLAARWRAFVVSTTRAAAVASVLCSPPRALRERLPPRGNDGPQMRARS